MTVERVYLVGFMGAGKTTVGRELAARVEAPFFDLDDLIESAEKMSIKDIFAQHGEPYFRKRERDLLRSTRNRAFTLLASGGATRLTSRLCGRRLLRRLSC